MRSEDRGADGREVLQVRTPLGIEQYELEGRPDGLRPYGEESVLDHAEAQVLLHTEQAGETEGFVIDDRVAVELQQEGLLYYYRYLVCFQIGEYDVVIRDARRNLRMFDLLKLYCTDTEVVNDGEQYRPYVMRMASAAEALQAIANSDSVRAKSVIRKAMRAISALPAVPTATFEHERKRSLAILGGMLKALPQSRRPTEEEVLRRELEKAVAQENYERAATLRDQLRGLAAPGGEPAHGPGERYFSSS